MNLLSICTGCAFAWSSPVVPKLYTDDQDVNPLGAPITVLEESWIGSLVSLGAAAGSVLASITAGKYGRRKTLLCFGLAFGVSHLMIAYGRIVEIYIIARFLMGIGAGSVFSSLPTFVGEISEDFNRGFMGSIMGMSLSFGAVLSYSVGQFVSIKTFSFVNLIPLFLFYPIVILMVPESPYFYASIPEETLAHNSLKRLRITSLGTQKKELKEIKAFLEEQRLNKPSYKNVFRTKALLRSLKITCGIMVFQQLAGITPISAFLESIFVESGSSISTKYSVIIVAIGQFLVNIFVGYAVDKLGRKILLIMSSLGSCLTAASLGTFFYLKTNSYDVSSLNWLPIASLILFIIAFNLGLGPLPWTISGEIFSSNIKSLASCITCVVCLLGSFLITMVFPSMVKYWGMAFTLWFFSGGGMLAFIFTVLVVPETKGRSLKEIQELLGS